MNDAVLVFVGVFELFSQLEVEVVFLTVAAGLCGRRAKVRHPLKSVDGARLVCVHDHRLSLDLFLCGLLPVEEPEQLLDLVRVQLVVIIDVVR